MFCKDFQKIDVFENDLQKIGFGVCFERPKRRKILKKSLSKLMRFQTSFFNGFDMDLGGVWGGSGGPCWQLFSIFLRLFRDFSRFGEKITFLQHLGGV